MKKIRKLLFFGFLLFGFVSPLFAQPVLAANTNCAVTVIGAPPPKLPVLPSGCSFSATDNNLTITKSTAQTTFNYGDDIIYTITVKDTQATEDIILTDVIPKETTYLPNNISNLKAKFKYDAVTRTVTWSAKANSLPVPVNTSFELVLKATTDKIYTANIVNGTAIGSSAPAPSSSIAKLFPNPIPADTPRGTSQKAAILKKYTSTLIAVYKQAGTITGMPWQILAGIHFREGLSTTTSLVSGRTIGANEPDVVSATGGNCNGPQGNGSDGKPEHLAGGGCKFSSLLDTAVYAGNLLKGKIGGIPQTFQDMVEAVSRYNGGGNRNCGRGSLAPKYGGTCLPYRLYPHLIAPFYGDDDDYAMNLFDDPHDPMYIIYCGDHALCGSATLDSRPGVVTVIKWVSLNLK